MPQPHCPNCGGTLKDEYGMQNCRSCGNVVLIDFDGNIKMGNEEAPAEPIPDLGPPQIPEKPAQFQASETTGIRDSITFDMNPTPEASSPAFPMTPVEPDWNQAPAADMQPMDVAPQADLVQADFPQNVEEPVRLEPMDSTPESEVNLFDMPAGAPLAAPKAVEAPPAAGFGPPGDPLGLNDFANSEASQARDGLYLFKLTIDGIDSKEIRDSLREALEDTRFGWDVANLMSRIDKGRLVLDRMAPVKASVAVQRCKSLPVRMWWEQFSVTEGDVQN